METIDFFAISHSDELKVLFECYKLATGKQKKMVKYLLDMELALAVHDKALQYAELKKELKEDPKLNVISMTSSSTTGDDNVETD